MSDFNLMEQSIKTGEKRKAKEIIDFVEEKRKEHGKDYYADYFIMQELLSKLRRDIE